jgi:hypothetical protein
VRVDGNGNLSASMMADQVGTPVIMRVGGA